MRAAAILGPWGTSRDLGDFSAGAELAIIESPQPGYDCILLFGGDGTVHRHLPGLLRAQTPLLMVPAGSGNDFARALGLGTRERALAAWKKFCSGAGNVLRIDVGVIKTGELRSLGQPGAPPPQPANSGRAGDPGAVPTHFFVCVAGAGLDSAVNRVANRLPRWLRGRGGYILALPAALLSFRPQRITLELAGSGDGISEPAMLAAFANAPAYGHRMRIAPRAELSDGRLDVCFVRRTGKLRLLRFFPKVFSGAHLEMPEVEYRQVERLWVSSETRLDIYADGEYICPTPAEISVLPLALVVVVP